MTDETNVTDMWSSASALVSSGMTRSREDSAAGNVRNRRRQHVSTIPKSEKACKSIFGELHANRDKISTRLMGEFREMFAWKDQND